MSRTVKVVVLPNPEADLNAGNDLEVFGHTVELRGAQAEAVLRIAEGTQSVIGIAADVERLACLSAVQYDRVRKSEAQALGIRITTLDKQVEAARTRTQEANGENCSLEFNEPSLWPHEVDGTELLGELVGAFRRHVVFQLDSYSIACALWTLHAWAHDCATVSPILAITSPEKRCGKTTLLMLLKRLTPRSLTAANISAPAVFRAVEKWRPTLLIDEADTFLRDSDELRGVLNSGHTREGPGVIRTVGDDHEPCSFSTWAPKAIALIGKLPTTLHDRAIEIRLARKLPSERVERLRADDDSFGDLRRRCARWVEDNADGLRVADPEIPSELHDRAADNWRALIAIADNVGGEWPVKARTAATRLRASDDGDEAVGVLLLADLRAMFAERGRRLLSAEIIAALTSMEHQPWPEWSNGHPLTARQLAKLLRPFGIQPRTIRAATERAKGYEVSQFDDAFARYLLPIRDTVTRQEIADFSETAIRDKAENVTDGKSQKPPENEGCHGVTDKKREAQSRNDADGWQLVI